MILIIISGVSLAVVALDAARLWHRAVMAAAIICPAQIALLVSPPVYGALGPRRSRYGRGAGLNCSPGRRHGCCHAACRREHCSKTSRSGRW
jgi:hypothetical protein